MTVEKLEKNIKTSFWALSNLTACQSKENGDNPILEIFVRIDKCENETQRTWLENTCSIDQVIQQCYLVDQKLQKPTLLIESTICLLNYLTCCTQYQLEQTNLRLCLDLLLTDLLPQHATLLPQTYGPLLLSLSLEFLARLLDHASQIYPMPVGKLTDNVFELVEELGVWERLEEVGEVVVRDEMEGRGCEGLDAAIKDLFTKYYSKYNN